MIEPINKWRDREPAKQTRTEVTVLGRLKVAQGSVLNTASSCKLGGLMVTSGKGSGETGIASAGGSAAITGRGVSGLLSGPSSVSLSAFSGLGGAGGKSQGRGTWTECAQD